MQKWVRGFIDRNWMGMLRQAKLQEMQRRAAAALAAPPGEEVPLPPDKPPNARDKVLLLHSPAPQSPRACQRAATRCPTCTHLPRGQCPLAADLLLHTTPCPQVKRAFSFKRKQPKPPPSQSPAPMRPPALSSPAKSCAAPRAATPFRPPTGTPLWGYLRTPALGNTHATAYPTHEHACAGLSWLPCVLWRDMSRSAG